MRAIIYHNKQYSGERIQLGLATRDLESSILRTKSVWVALQQLGMYARPDIVCCYQTDLLSEKRTEEWHYERERVALSPGKNREPRMIVVTCKSAKRRLGVWRNRNGDFVLDLPVRLRDLSVRTVPIPLYTDDPDRARDHARAVVKSLETILGRPDDPDLAIAWPPFREEGA